MKSQKMLEKYQHIKKQVNLLRGSYLRLIKIFKKLSASEKVVLLGSTYIGGVVISHVCNIDQKKIDFAIDDSKTKYNTFFSWKNLKFIIGKIE